VREALKILFFPFAQSNPYQQQLSRCLQSRGDEVDYLLPEQSPWGLFQYLCGRKRVDILHLHWTHPYLLGGSLPTCFLKALRFFIFLVLAKAVQVKLVWTIHNLGSHEKQHPRFERFCHRQLVALCDKIIVHSQYAQKKVMAEYRIVSQNHSIHVIPHGNYIDIYPNTFSRENARRELGILHDQQVFLYFGQIRSYKGIPELLEAFSQLNAPRAFLMIAGRPYDVDLCDRLNDMIKGKENVRASLEFVPDERIQVYMNAADAIVLPFQDIFTSGSLLLAMSFGKAIILPALDSLDELIDDLGFLSYSPADQEGLRCTMQEALSKDLLSMGGHNLEKAQTFDWQRIGEMTRNVYLEAVLAPKKSVMC
jgi:glycosyltransferase involved in cell wall biosynthesis